MNSDRRIRLLTLGGTISMTERDVGAVPALGAADLALFCDSIASWEDVSLVGGSEVTLGILSELTNRIRSAFANGTSGVVVTSGTDAIEETASWLAYCGPWDRPIVVTGSMLPGDRADSDARANLCDSVATARSAGNVWLGNEPLVVFAGRIYIGREVVKTSGVERTAFDAPGRGPVGAVLAGVAKWYRAVTAPLVTVGPPLGPVPHVPIVTATLDDDGWLLSAAADRYPALVVAGNGAGNLPPAQAEAAAHASGKGKLVVVVSRAPDALTAPLYAYPGGSATLKEAGVVLASDLTPHRARLLVALALSRGLSATEIARLVGQAPTSS